MDSAVYTSDSYSVDAGNYLSGNRNLASEYHVRCTGLQTADTAAELRERMTYFEISIIAIAVFGVAVIKDGVGVERRHLFTSLFGSCTPP